MTELNVKDLSICLKKENRYVVNGMSFTIRGGDSLILLGQSGCGKTMTCRAVMGLLEKNLFSIGGSILFDGNQLLGLPEKRRRAFYGSRIAFIPQNPMTALDPSMRIGRQMEEHLKVHTDLDRRLIHDCIRDSLARAGLTDTGRILRAFPYMLSGGMLQRILIAMAFLTNVELVIGDEPTTALDVVHRNETVDAIARLREAGAAVLLVTHDFAAALRLGGDVLVILEGREVERGKTGEVYATPQTEYTKALLRACALSKGGSRLC